MRVSTSGGGRCGSVAAPARCTCMSHCSPPWLYTSLLAPRTPHVTHPDRMSDRWQAEPCSISCHHHAMIYCVFAIGVRSVVLTFVWSDPRIVIRIVMCRERV